jgi:hypothetical protein
VERFADPSPTPRSDGLPSQPTGVQHPRKRTRAEQAVDSDKAGPPWKRAHMSKPSDFQDPTAQASSLIGTRIKRKSPQPPATSIVTHGPTRRVRVPQTRYRCATKQGSWEEEAPIEFGGIRLTDAADPTYTGFSGHGDKVLNHQGVGSSISCRINVRQTFQPPRHVITHYLLFLSFPGATSRSQR